MTIRMLTGDCRGILKTLPDESVHCCVTSPPYFGLRDYGTAKWEGGDERCEHTGVARRCDNPGRNDKQSTQKGSSSDRVSRECLYCGATRIDNQIGLEPTPDAYVAELVSVFREVRRALRRDGTLWLNLGDSYSTHAAGKVANPMAKSTLAGVRTQEIANESSRASGAYLKCGSLPEKNLIGIPWMVAFALRADGWYLRQDIIWSKPNPMPESVTDRCTKAHEYLFLLSKSPRYYYDAEAIKEPFADERMGNPGEFKNGYSDGAGRKDGLTKGMAWNVDGMNNGRNKRSVWEVATQPFSEAHFATFPPVLIEPCIKAGTSEKGCCGTCGSPLVREIEKSGSSYAERKASGVGGPYNGKPEEYQTCGASQSKTLGWSPSCSCNTATRPCTVLDPFAGAGTTGMVADRLGRSAVLIELNPTYGSMVADRLREDAGLFLDMKML